MSSDLKDILSNSNKDIGNQQLMDYLSNQLSKQQQHEVEQSMADDPFVSDAMEGLQQLPNQQYVPELVDQLNDALQKQLNKNKNRRDKRRFKDSPFSYIAVVVLLLLMIICFILVKKHLDKKQALTPPATTSAVTTSNSRH